MSDIKNQMLQIQKRIMQKLCDKEIPNNEYNFSKSN